MRPKLIAAALLITSGVLLIAMGLSKVSSIPKMAAPAPESGSEVSVQSSSSAPAARSANPSPTMMASVRPLARTNNETTNVIASSGADHARFIRERSAELVALAMLPDASAHQTIISELKNPDKEIRQTALEALKQVTDRSIVPQMQAVADQTDDPNEKQAILDAIEYINLPSLTEYLHKTSNSAGNSPPPQTSPTK